MTAMSVAEITSVGIQNVTEDLTPAQVRHLSALERRIERGLHTFRDVGEALLEIRDHRLYRMTHPTFEAYCAERWQLARQRAYQLMGAAEVIQVLGEAGDRIVNEAQARELVPLLHTNPKLVPQVVKEVSDAGEVTAPAIRKAVMAASGESKPAPRPVSATDRLISKIESLVSEYMEWTKSRPSRKDRARVSEVLTRLQVNLG